MTASAEFTLEKIRELLAAGLFTNTELPAAVLLADGGDNPTAPAVASHLLAWNVWSGTWRRVRLDDDDGLMVGIGAENTVNTELPPPGSLIDAMGLPTSVLVGGVGYAYNGDNVDRVRNNHQIIALASQARVATVTSASLTNYNAKGIAIYLDVTAVGAPAGTITQIEVLGVIGGTEVVLYTFDIVDLAAVGTRHLLLYPGAATAGNWSLAPVQGVLPREFRIRATHLDASSITYSVTVDFIN